MTKDATSVDPADYADQSSPMQWYGRDFVVDGGVWYWSGGSDFFNPNAACVEDEGPWSWNPGPDDTHSLVEPCSDGTERTEMVVHI